MPYLLRFQAPPKAMRKNSLSGPGEIDIRYDNTGHFVQSSNGRRRCMGEYCKSHVRTVFERWVIGVVLRHTTGKNE